jgi:aminomethyltransferase
MGALETVLHASHLAAGGKLVDFAGYRMPIQYGSMLEEHLLVRRKGGIFDVSHMGEFFVQGPQAEAFLDRMTVNHVARLAHGQVQYSAMMTPGGGIVDDLLVHRFDDERFLLVVNASNRAKDLAWLQAHLEPGVEVVDRSDEFSLLALQGREAYGLVLELADQDLSDLPYYWFREGSLGGLPLILARTGYTGERGFELYVENARAAELWERLLPALQERGMGPVGLGARDSLRLEMKFALYGNDIDETTSTIEANLDWITRTKKKRDFLGKEVVLRHKAEGVDRRLVGFELLERGIPRHGQPCFLGDEPVGTVTSGGHSPVLDKAIGMAYLRPPLDAVGSGFQVELRGRRVPARVVPTPFVELEVPSR